MQSNERSKHLSYFFSKADDGVERQKSKAKMRAITYLRKCGVCWLGYVWGVCEVCVWRMWGGGTFRGREGGGGVNGEKVSLAALLSGYLGKSGHLPR